MESIRWTGEALLLLDQRVLPLEERWLKLTTAAAVAEAITAMVVRGAPAIAITAAYGMALAVAAGEDRAEAAARLLAARPTAVNLGWAISRMSRRAAEVAHAHPDDRAQALLAEAEAIHLEDVAACRAMGELGAADVPDGATILTHCNAGALATGGYGTALGVVRAAHAQGKGIRVLADETRPYLQGARLTAWELQQDGIPVEVITDNMAGHFFQRGEVDFVVVGSDRIARNGDVANKIGTYTVALLANHHEAPFTVAAPWSTFDLSLPNGDAIPIEERASEEVGQLGGAQFVPDGIVCRHPAFDVTPAAMVDAIYTERGVIRPRLGETPAQLSGQGEPG